jgi:hypothetical protein
MKRRSLFVAVVVSSLVAVVVSILFLPVFLLLSGVASKEVSPGKHARCISNLHGIAGALAMYADDYNGIIPPAGAEGLGLIRANLPSSKSSPSWFHCPADTIRHESATNAPLDEDHCSYVYVGGTWGFSSELVDGRWQTKTVTNPVPICWDKPENHGSDGLSVLFNDAHVRWLTLEDWAKIKPNR